MTKSGKNLVDRRKFLKGAAVGSIATLVGSTGAIAAQQALAGVATQIYPQRSPMRGILSAPLKF